MTMRTFGVFEMSEMQRGLARETRRVSAFGRFHFLLVDALVAYLLLSLTGGAAFAQKASKDDPFAGVEEMIVTGGGAAALLVPSGTQAITFDASDLAAYGVEDIGDIAAQVPNLEIRTANATNAAFFVRGVGLQDFGANASSSVPIFQDGVPRNPSATQLTGLYDIGVLNVLKGPQGSGNFRNSSAGAFVIKTTKPEPEFSGYATSSVKKIVSVDAHDANQYTGEMAFNFPVYEDIISARVSARYRHENPFFENGCANRLAIPDRPVRVRPADLPNVPNGVLTEEEAQICGENVQRKARIDPLPTGISHVNPYLNRYLGEVDEFAFRGQLRFEPPDSGMDWVFRVELSRLNRDSTLGQVIGTAGGYGGGDVQGYQDPDIANRVAEIMASLAPSNPGLSDNDLEKLATPIVGREILKRPLDAHPYRGDFDKPGKTILDTHGASTTGLIDFDDFNLEINAGYLDYRLSEVRDTDLSPNILFPAEGNDQAWEVYGDFKFSGDAAGDIPLRWDVGAYTLIEQVEAVQQQQVFEVVRTNQYTQEIYSFGAFAQGEYEFLEAFTLSGGVRYNWERKDFEVRNSRPIPPVPGQPDFGLIVEKSENQRTWDALTGFVMLKYAFTEDVSAYMKYSRGFKAGHFNPSRANAAKVPGLGFADPETIDSFEWGVDFAAWQNRISGKGAFFFYNYKNYQVFRLTTTQQGVFRTIQNADEARNYGIELELTMTPLEGIAPEAIEGLRFNLRAGWLETSFVEFSVAEERNLGNQGTIGVPINFSGNSLLNAPNLQVSGTITWPLFLNRLGTLTPQYDFSWSDDVPFDPNNGRGELDPFGDSQFRPYTIGNRAYILHNLRLTWEPPGGESQFSVSGWCRNVADERYKTFAVDLATFATTQLIFVSDPRTCGADVRFSF